MKYLSLVFCAFTLLYNEAMSYGGEFRMQYIGQNKPHQVSIRTKVTNPSTPSWLWDNVNNRAYVSSDLYFFFSDANGDFDNTTFAYFDCPKNDDVASNDALPWGIIQIQVHFNSTDIHYIEIDFRDEDWSTNAAKYPGHDFILEIYTDTNPRTVKLRQANHSTITLTPNQTSEPKLYVKSIWETFNAGSALQTNFAVPVLLKNRTEGGAFDFGSLRLNGNVVTSGSFGGARVFSGNGITHETVEYIAGQDRY